MRAGRFPISVATVVTVVVAYAAVAASPVNTAAALRTPTKNIAIQPPSPSAVQSSSARPSPAASTSPPPLAVPSTISWPQANEAAVTVSGASAITVHGGTGPVPIASLAKMMTAYVILTDHPLTGSSQGPAITVTDDDAELYTADAAAGSSVVQVRAGEKLTERQALEALLLQSANNVAVLLADWDAGGVPRFLGRMNGAASRLGLRSTHYADPAGLDQHTASTASDQVRLALAALGQPAFASIVALQSAVVPVAGTIVNHDTMLGVDGIVGVKTGYTAAAGGTMVVAAWAEAGGAGGRGHRVLIVGAVLGLPGGAATAFGRTLDAGDQLVVGVERWLQD
jgi:D-alanyl-D-alanine carboxypeptidase (penicillin-binding protein 5/6)